MFNTSKESACPLSRKLNHLSLSCFSFILPLLSLLPPSRCGSIVTWALKTKSKRESSRVESQGEKNKGASRETFSGKVSKAQQSIIHSNTVHRCFLRTRFLCGSIRWMCDHTNICGRKWTQSVVAVDVAVELACLHMVQQQMFCRLWWFYWQPMVDRMRCPCALGRVIGTELRSSFFITY